MELKEKISLETLNDKQFKIRIEEPEKYNEAVLTHYLHNSKNGVSQRYKSIDSSQNGFLHHFLTVQAV